MDYIGEHIKSCATEEIGRWGQPIRARALELAISVVKEAWAILDQELRKDGYEDEMPLFEGGSRYDYYCELDTQALEDSDSVYFNASDDRRRVDDKHLSYFESRFKVRDDFSPRLKALALRTLAKDLVGVAAIRPEAHVESALSLVVLNSDGSVDTVSTYKNYRPYYPLDRVVAVQVNAR